MQRTSSDQSARLDGLLPAMGSTEVVYGHCPTKLQRLADQRVPFITSTGIEYVALAQKGSSVYSPMYAQLVESNIVAAKYDCLVVTDNNRVMQRFESARLDPVV